MKSKSTYRAVQAIGPGRLQLTEKPLQAPGPGMVRIQIEACGVCHSDAGTVEGSFRIEWPRVPGHKVVGRLNALGSGVQGWQLGQRVGVGFLGGFCGYCGFCRSGDLVHCRNQESTGVQREGGYAEAMIARASALVSVPVEFQGIGVDRPDISNALLYNGPGGLRPSVSAYDCWTALAGHSISVDQVQKIPEYGGNAACMSSHGVPPALPPVVITTEVPGALAVVLKWRHASRLSHLRTIRLAAVIFYHHLANQIELVPFLKHVWIAGRLPLLVANDSSPLSLDQRRTTRRLSEHFAKSDRVTDSDRYHCPIEFLLSSWLNRTPVAHPHCCYDWFSGV